MTNRVTQLIDIKTEQRKDPALRKFMPWIQNGITDDIQFVPFELKKQPWTPIAFANAKKRISVCQLLDDLGLTFHHQVCIPKLLRQELFYTSLNSPKVSHIGIALSTQEFRNRLFFRGFIEFLMVYIKKFPSCSPLKRVNKKQLNLFLNHLIATTSYLTYNSNGFSWFFSMTHLQ